MVIQLLKILSQKFIYRVFVFLCLVDVLDKMMFMLRSLEQRGFCLKGGSLGLLVRIGYNVDNCYASIKVY